MVFPSLANASQETLYVATSPVLVASKVMAGRPVDDEVNSASSKDICTLGDDSEQAINEAGNTKITSNRAD